VKIKIKRGSLGIGWRLKINGQWESYETKKALLAEVARLMNHEPRPVGVRFGLPAVEWRRLHEGSA
jgi:hypothetical protein